MSFRVYDYLCRQCNTVEERFVRLSEVDEQYCNCEEDCQFLMDRLPCAPHLDYDGMGNDPDMHTAWEKKGDMLTERHKKAGQYHTGYEPE